MNKKLLSVLLCVLMAVIMIPSSVFAAELPFADVAEDAWYYNDVKAAYDTGLINGMTETEFQPESNMTYAQAVKLAACMHQKYTTGQVTLTNGSVNWWDSYVYYAKAFNIISRDYDWNSNATRAGYVEIFAEALPDEALEEKNLIVDNYIPDVTMIHPQAQAIYKLYRAGILTGMDAKGTFQPDNDIKRSHVCAILKRMMNKDARKEFTLGPDKKTYIVGFSSGGGSAVEAQQVAENGKVVKPDDPVREGYRFAGWYSDSSLTAMYDFDSPVTENFFLYAKWTDSQTAVYTVSFNSTGGSAVSSQTVVENGKAVKPADPVLKDHRFAGWYKDSGLTTEYSFESPVTGDITLHAKWEETASAGSIADNWDTIAASVSDGTYKSKYHIGDTKLLDLGSEGVVEMQIAAFDTDELADGSGKAAVTWISKSILKTDHRINPECVRDPADETQYKQGTGAIGGWEYSQMRTWLKDTIKPSIPSEVRNAIKPVVKYSFSRSTSNKNVHNVRSTEDVWIPSLKEVCKSTAYTETEGPSYSELFKSKEDLIKQKDGTAGTWWLRSACYISSFFNINTDGTLSYNYVTSSDGVVLGFCM